MHKPTTKVLSVGALLACLAALAACSAGPWHKRAPLLRDHPLVGVVWDVRTEGRIAREALMDRLAAARFVLLGERHDNPDHHRIQADVLGALVARGKRPAVVMEMLDLDDSEAIVRCRMRWWCSAKRLARAVDWDRSGWPSWRIYEPVLRAVLKYNLPLAPGSLRPADVRRFRAEGVLPTDAPTLHLLGVDRPLPADLARAMRDEIRDAHCGYAPEDHLEAMVAVQRLRDAHLAESLFMAAPMGRAVLIAGNGHVRNDRGVVMRLGELAPHDATISVGLLEVVEGRTAASAYAEDFAVAKLPFDYVWFTARVDDIDPCDEYRERLETLGRPAG